MYYPQDSDQAEIKAREDYTLKLQGGVFAELDLVTVDNFTILESNVKK
jgi:hypothetical protein